MTLCWKPFRLLDSTSKKESDRIVEPDLRTLHPAPCAEQAAPQPSTPTVSIPDPSAVDAPTNSANAGLSSLETDAPDDDGFEFNFDFVWRSDSEEREEPVSEAEVDVISDESEVCTSFHTPDFRG